MIPWFFGQFPSTVTPKKLYVQYSNATADTAQALAHYLRAFSGNGPPDKRYQVVINYGSFQICPENHIRDGTVNTAQAVLENSSDKGRSLQRMRDAGVNVARIMSPKEALSRGVYPIIAREAQHRSGSGCRICLTKFDILDAMAKEYSHFIEFIHIMDEYRIHLFDGEAYLLQQKIKGGQVLSEHIRTGKNGWVLSPMSRYHSHVPNTVFDQAHRAMSTTDLVFGAVDVGITENGEAYVFEINTGAGMTKYEAYKILGDKIQKYVKEKFDISVKCRV